MESVIIDGVKFVAEKPCDPKPYVVIRSRDAGVFAGYLESHNDSTVVLRESRRIWYWDGAATLSQLSQEGVKKVSNCKFPQEVPLHTILGVCEILPTTQEAKQSIQGVPVWKI